MAFEGGVKSEDDVLFGDASIDEFEGDAAFRAVVLDPDFVVADVEVEDAAVDALFVVPADLDELVSIAAVIKDEFGFEFWVAEVDFAVVGEEFLDELAVVG